MIFQLVYHGSAVTRHPLSQVLSSAEATQRGVTQSPSSRFSGGGKKKKNVKEAVAVIYAKYWGLHGGRGVLLWGPLHLQTGINLRSYREVNYTWLQRVSKT